MNWLILVLAGFLECTWMVGMRYSHGFTRLWPSVITIVATVASTWLLCVAVKTLPVGAAYAVWTGIGAASTAIAGIFLFDEPASAARLVCIALIAVGVAGLAWLKG